MGVLLVHVPNLVWDDDRHQTDQSEIALMAMGLFAIADRTDRQGIPVEMINLSSTLAADPSFDLVGYVEERRPQVVGFSVHWAKQLQSSLKFAALMARAVPATRVVMGGFSASYFAREILEGHPGVHAVVRGDGEVPFVQYAQAVTVGREDLGAIPNLAWRRDGAIVENPRTYTAAPADVEDCDFARFDLLRDADYYAPTYWTIRPDVAHQKAFIVSTGRGCAFNCSFCGGAAVAQMVINNRRRFMFRSPESVLKTIEKAVERGFTNLYFDYDPDPNGRYYYELFDLLRRRGLQRLTICFGAWALPDEPFIQELRRTFAIGLIQISPETFSEEARRRNKDARIHYTNEQLEHCIRAIGVARLYSQVYFGYVMPYDTKAAVYQTVQYVEYLNERYGATCEARNLRFSTDPGSPAFQRPEKYDITLFARRLDEYLAMVDEANRRGYLNNLQLFKVNSMSDRDNYLAGQLPPAFYHIKRAYPAALRLLIVNLGFERLIGRIQDRLLLPRWTGAYDPLEHSFTASHDAVYTFLQEQAQASRQPLVGMVLAREHARHTAPSDGDVPLGHLNSYA